MTDWLYLSLGLLWIVACLAVGLYINGKGMSDKWHYRFGLKTIIISYLVGIFLLFMLIMRGG
jgi:hypothetical protein